MWLPSHATCHVGTGSPGTPLEACSSGRRRHGRFTPTPAFVGLAEQAATRLRRADQVRWLDRIEADEAEPAGAIDRASAMAMAARLGGSPGRCGCTGGSRSKPDRAPTGDAMPWPPSPAPRFTLLPRSCRTRQGSYQPVPSTGKEAPPPRWNWGTYRSREQLVQAPDSQLSAGEPRLSRSSGFCNHCRSPSRARTNG